MSYTMCQTPQEGFRVAETASSDEDDPKMKAEAWYGNMF